MTVFQGTDAAVQSLIHFLWQGALLGAAGAAVLRRTETAEVRYTVACVLLALMACAPLATFALLASGDLPMLVPEPEFAASATPGFGADIATLSGPPWVRFAFAAWLAGVACFVLRATVAWILAARRVSAGRQPAADWVRSAASRIARRLQITRAVEVFESSCLAVPCAFGAVRSVVVLPASMVTGLSREQVEAILAHELAHIARHDFLVNCFQTAVECLLFYHPAVWWLSNRIRQDRELCCDAAAVRICGDRLSYARALLALEEWRGAFLMAATAGGLRDRIARLASVPVPEERQLVPVLLPAGVLGAVLIAATAMFADQPPPAPASATASYEREIALVGTARERADWRRLKSDREREQFLLEFWRRRDPNPSTPQNEAKEEHRRRIRYAEERYGDWNTPRGRVYVVQGPPAEIESHPREFVEIWRYSDGRVYEFRGPGYPLVRSPSR